CIATDGEPEPRAGANERRPRTERQRQPKRIGLDRATGDDVPPDRNRGEVPRHRDGGHSRLVDQTPAGGARAGEDVRAEIKPDIVARLRPDPPAEPLL